MCEPGEDFADIAVALFELARLEAMNVEGCEHLVAKAGDHAGMQAALSGLRRRAELLGAAHLYFKAMLPVERQVKLLMLRQYPSADVSLVPCGLSDRRAQA